MNIAIDLRVMSGASRYRGIGMYVLNLFDELLPKLLKVGSVSLYVYDKECLAEFDQEIIKLCKIVTAVPPVSSKLPSIFNKFFVGILPREFARKDALPNVGACDVFFQPYHEMGIPSSVKDRSIVVCYDLIPLIFANEFFSNQPFSLSPKSLLKYLRQKVQKKVYLQGLAVYKSAERILAISENTKQTVMELLHIAEEKMTVTYLAEPKNIGENTAVSAKFKKKLQATEYIAYIGGIDSRRPILDLLKAASSIYSSTGKKLAVAGNDFVNHSNQEIVTQLSKEYIINLGRISESEKDYLLKNAFASVYPTHYEGFGLPVLEAFSKNTPIITYNNSSIPEVAGDAAIYIESVDEIPAKLKHLASDPSYKQALVEAGRKQAALFSWKKCANETLESILSVSKK